MGRPQDSDLKGRDLGKLRPKSPSEQLEPQRATARPRGKREKPQSQVFKKFVRVTSGLLTVSLLSMAGLGASSVYFSHQYEQPGPLDVSRTIAIPKGEGRLAIAERLEKEGVITSRWAFLVGHGTQSWFSNKKSLELKAGDYEIKKNASMREVVDLLSDGSKAVLAKFTVPEGLTSQLIVDKLINDPDLTGDIAAVPPETGQSKK